MKKGIISLQMMLISAVVMTVGMSGPVVRMVVGTGDRGGGGECSASDGHGGGGTDRGAVAVVLRGDSGGERQCE